MGPIEEYLTTITHKSSASNYKAHLLAFIDTIAGPQRAARKVTAEEYERYERLAEEYLQTASPVVDLGRLVKTLDQVAPNTAKQRFAVAVDFLAHHGYDLTQKERKALAKRIPKGGTQIVEGDMDHAILASMFRHMDSRGRAIGLCLASSGMRIGELLAVPMSDVDLDADPAEIIIRGAITKNRIPRTVFISAEAVVAVREWLRVRDDVLTRSIGRASGFIAAGIIPEQLQDDPRLFPFTVYPIRDTWISALRKCGLYRLDPSTGRTTLHIHMLRKFFHSQAKLGAPEEVVEALMGHSGYLSGAYRRYTKKQLGEYYKKAEPHLTILIPNEYVSLKSQVSEKLNAHSEILQNMMAKNIRNEAEVDRLKAQVAILTEMLQEERIVEVARELAAHDDE